MATSDATAYFSAYIISRAHVMPPSGTRKKRATESYLMAKCSAATITQTLIRDWGADEHEATASIAAEGTETRCRRRFEATDVADWVAIQIKLGDVGGEPDTTPIWRLDRFDGLAEVQDGAK